MTKRKKPLPYFVKIHKQIAKKYCSQLMYCLVTLDTILVLILILLTLCPYKFLSLPALDAGTQILPLLPGTVMAE